ncbi:iron reductase [Imleria badia]|nr:iron reductase [Imleria badia]
MGSPPPPPSPTLTTPEQAWFSLCIFFAVVGIFQWGSVLHSKVVKQRRPRKSPDEESTHTSSTNGGRSLARLPIVAVNVFRVVAFRWTLEFGTYDLKVADIFLTLTYVAFLLGWTFEGAEKDGVTRLNIGYWSGRAGLLAASQFPLVTALGTKNNVVSFVTGVGYEKLNFLHRVTARSCFLLLLFHAGGKIYEAESFDIVKLLLEKRFIRLGLTAVVSLTILLIVSLRAIRSRVYELFFYTHFVAVFIFLIGAYFHTRHANASYWIWPSFMFWALDRFVRVARVVLCNHLYCGFSRRARLQDATTELLCDDFVRVTVRRPAHFQWSPGQTAYLIMPSVSAFPLEAHPFSISSIDSTLFRPRARDEHSTSGEAKETAETAHWKELVFIINVRGGFTKRLKEIAAQSTTVKLFIDGPYGCAPDMGAYDTSILIAGGSGITYTLPVFLNVIEAARKGSSQCRRVVFIWAVRDASHVQWISDALYRASALTPTWLNVSIRIFATRGGIPFSESLVDPEQTPDKEGSQNWMVPPSVRLENGRPDLKAILHGEVNTASGSMAVTGVYFARLSVLGLWLVLTMCLVCGSQSLARSVRRALRFPVSGPHSILSGGPSVTLHVESFGYA